MQAPEREPKTYVILLLSFLLSDQPSVAKVGFATAASALRRFVTKKSCCWWLMCSVYLAHPFHSLYQVRVAQPDHPNKGADSHIAREPVYELPREFGPFLCEKIIEFFSGHPWRGDNFTSLCNCSRPCLQSVESTLSDLKSCNPVGGTPSSTAWKSRPIHNESGAHIGFRNWFVREMWIGPFLVMMRLGGQSDYLPNPYSRRIILGNSMCFTCTQENF